MMNHRNCTHEASSAARKACRQAIADLKAAFDRVPGNEYNDWLRYAARAFAEVDTNDRSAQAAAVLRYFATTDYQPTTDPRAIVAATLRRAS